MISHHSIQFTLFDYKEKINTKLQYSKQQIFCLSVLVIMSWSQMYSFIFNSVTMNFISPSHMTPSYILSIGDIKERLKGIMKRENTILVLFPAANCCWLTIMFIKDLCLNTAVILLIKFQTFTKLG